MNPHREHKRLYESYRATAKLLYENQGSIDSAHISVSTASSTVHVMEDGAFVEARIWIPKCDLLKFTDEELKS